MSSVKELEKALAKAKAEEFEAKRAAFLERFNSTWAGKAFVQQGASRSSRYISLSKYYTAKLRHRYEQDDDDIVEYRKQNILVQAGLPPRCWETAGYTRTDRVETVHARDLYNMPTQEIPLALFKTSWEHGSNMANMMFDQLTEATGSGEAAAKWLVAATENCDFEAAKVDIDVPYLPLQPHDTTLFNGSPFLMPAYRYLLTPASISDGLRRVADSESDLMRGSQFWQECDMRYVESKREQHARIRAALMTTKRVGA